jgi:hypothetical protein
MKPSASCFVVTKAASVISLLFLNPGNTGARLLVGPGAPLPGPIFCRRHLWSCPLCRARCAGRRWTTALRCRSGWATRRAGGQRSGGKSTICGRGCWIAPGGSMHVRNLAMTGPSAEAPLGQVATRLRHARVRRFRTLTAGSLAAMLACPHNIRYEATHGRKCPN